MKTTTTDLYLNTKLPGNLIYEKATEMQLIVGGEVVYSTFDESVSRHVQEVVITMSISII